MPKQLLSVPINSLQPTVPTESLIEDFKISARTSIARSSPSAPLKQLLSAGLIKGSVLNYGKGRTNQDSDEINKVASVCKGKAYIAARSSTDRGLKGVREQDGLRTLRSTFQKGYLKNELKQEAQKYFASVREIPTKGAFRLVECSHDFLEVAGNSTQLRLVQ